MSLYPGVRGSQGRPRAPYCGLVGRSSVDLGRQHRFTQRGCVDRLWLLFAPSSVVLLERPTVCPATRGSRRFGRRAVGVLLQALSVLSGLRPPCLRDSVLRRTIMAARSARRRAQRVEHRSSGSVSGRRRTRCSSTFSIATNALTLPPKRRLREHVQHRRTAKRECVQIVLELCARSPEADSTRSTR